jgi:hypothetical protein
MTVEEARLALALWCGAESANDIEPVAGLRAIVALSEADDATLAQASFGFGWKAAAMLGEIKRNKRLVSDARLHLSMLALAEEPAQGSA